MKYIFLTEDFYKDYANCTEIEQKRLRPYVMLIVQIDNLTFALPLRSHIKHCYAFITDEINSCGVDYSKAVVVSKPEYIDNKRQPRIRPNEYKVLVRKERTVTQEFMNYLADYKKAVKERANRTSYTYKYCTLQYFHKELGLV